MSGSTANVSACFLRSIRELLRVCAQKEKVSYTLKVGASHNLSLWQPKQNIALWLARV